MSINNKKIIHTRLLYWNKIKYVVFVVTHVICYTYTKYSRVNNMSIENEMQGINISIISVSFYIRTQKWTYSHMLSKMKIIPFFVYVQAHVWQLHVMRDIIARNKLLSFPSSNGERHCDTELPGFRLVFLI